jgi:uncharacterized membrane protein YeiH
VQNDLATSTLQILEIIGTLAFGASGLIAAARKKLDMVGVVLLVLVTAFGGRSFGCKTKSGYGSWLRRRF